MKTVLLCMYHCHYLLFNLFIFYYCGYSLNEFDNNLSWPLEFVEHLPESNKLILIILLLCDFSDTSCMHDLCTVTNCDWHHCYVSFSALGIQGTV